jgi:hypothetical protein
MLKLWSLSLLALPMMLLACAKGPAQPATGASTSGPSQWVTFDDDDEDEMDDLMVIELMKATAECGDLKKLEPSAMMGRLSDGEVRCLDDTLKAAERQTFKDKISRVLMADAWAKSDTHRWEALVRRHLNEVDRSDPNLCYKFALHLSKSSGEFSDEAMKWIDFALENRTHWKGELHTRRVNSLRKLKAYAAQKKWQWLEQDFARAPSAEVKAQALLARNEAKTYAREWLEYAKQAGKDYTQALQLCISAAGTESFCTGVLED